MAVIGCVHRAVAVKIERRVERPVAGRAAKGVAELPIIEGVDAAVATHVAEEAMKRQAARRGQFGAGGGDLLRVYVQTVDPVLTAAQYETRESQ